MDVASCSRIASQNSKVTEFRLALHSDIKSHGSNSTNPCISLPVELMRPIVESLTEEYSTLYSLSGTCSAVQFEAERVLYRCMKRYDWRMQIGFLQTIINNPVRASSVHVLHVLPRHFQLDAEYLQKCLTNAVQHMVNLKEFADGCYQQSLYPLMKSGPLTFKLERFSFIDESELEQSDYFVQFLTSQPGLLRLNLREDPNLSLYKTMGVRTLDRHIAPKLHFLRGSLAMLRAFLPSRKITSLDWEPSNRMVEGEAIKSIIPLIGPYLRHVKYFCVRKYAYHIKRPPLSIVAQYLENLEYLDLPGLQDHEISDLNMFPSLRGLALTGMPSPNSVYPDYSLSDFLIPVYQQCPHIIAIIVEVRSTFQTQSNREFQIWRPQDVQDQGGNPPIFQVPISELAFHHIFELLPI